MTRNQFVTAVIDCAAGDLQLEGTAREVHGETRAFVEDGGWEKYGPSEYLFDDKSVYFEIDTQWARLLADGSYPATYERLLGQTEASPLETD